MSKGNLLIKLITLTDFIGHEPTLKLGGSPRNRTFFGGLLCVTIYCFFILAALYFGQELVYRDIPTVIETSTLITKDDKILLEPSNFLFYLGLKRIDEQRSINISNILDISINLVEYKGESKTTQLIPTKTCDTDDFKVKTPSYKSVDDSFKIKHSPRNMLCLKLNDSNKYSLRSHDMYEYYSKIEITVTKKANVHEDSPDITNSVIELKIVDTELNMREFEKVGTLTLVNYDFALDQTRPKIIQMFLRLMTLKTDIGYMFEDFKERTFHKIEHVETLRMTNTKVFHLVKIEIGLSNKKYVNYRKYYKFQNWVAELGGIVRALTLIAFVLNYYNDKSTYYEQMINNLFDVDDIIKYYQYSIGDTLNNKGKRKARDSVVLCSVKKEKHFFEREYQQLYNNSELNINNFVGIPQLMKKNKMMRKTSSNDQKIVSNQVTSLNNNQNKPGSMVGMNTSNNPIKEVISNSNVQKISEKKSNSPSETSADPHECYIDSLKKSKQIKEHFEKVKKTRFKLSQVEVLLFCFCNKKDNPKYNSYMGGKELINERADIMYILRQNLQFDRLKNLLLRDYQILLLNSLTKFMLDPERVNLSDFSKCQYEKFIDAYDHSTCGNNIVDMKLSKWVETKYKFEK